MNRLAMILALVSLIVCADASPALSAGGRTISDPMRDKRSDTLGGVSFLQSRTADGRRQLSFTPARQAQCDYFIVAEAGIAQVSVEAQDWLDNHILRNSLGLMKNVTPNRSIGASVDAHWAHGTVTVSPAVRVRQWMGGKQSVEASLGYIRNDRQGLAGPIASLRYSPVPLLFVEAGASPVQELWWTYDPGTQVSRAGVAKKTHAFGGIGLTGAGSVAVWGGELVALGFVFAVLLGMSD